MNSSKIPEAPARSDENGQRSLQFVTVPAFFVALSFATGVVASRSLYCQPGPISIACLLGFMASLLCPRVSFRLAQISLLVAWMAAGLFCAEIERHPVASALLQNAVMESDSYHAVVAIVLPSPRPTAHLATEGDRTAQRLDLALVSLDRATSNPPNQIVRTTLLLNDGAVAPACNALLSFQAKLHTPPRFYTPGAFDQAAWLGQQNIFAETSVHADSVTAVSAPGQTLACRLSTLRNRTLDHLDLLVERMSAWPAATRVLQLNSVDASLLAAALLGDRSRIDPADRTAFQRVGAFHLLVVSGLSVAILAGAVWWCLRKLRASLIVSTVITLVLITGYAFLTGFATPVQRALLMTALYMVGRLIYRRASPLNTLSIAALLLIAMRPSDLFGASLQMTLLAVAAIAGIASPLLARSTGLYLRASQDLHVPLDAALAPPLAQFRITLRMWQRSLSPLLGKRASGWLPGAISRAVLRACELAFVSLVLELALAIPTAIYFHRVVALSIGSSLVTVPLLGLLLPIAIVTLLVATFSISAAFVPAALTAFLFHAASTAVHRIAALPQAEWRIPPPRPGAIALSLVCMLAAIFFAHKSALKYAIASIALTAAMAACALWSVPVRLHAAVIEVTALDVGQGDAIFLSFPQGKTIMVDSGGPAGPFAASGPYAGEYYGEEIVSPYLWSRGIRRLDAVALTHAHSDHMGGMPAVLRNFRPHELWIGANPATPSYEQLLELARSLGIQIRTLHAGDNFDFGGATIQVLAPPIGYEPTAIPQNDDSLVLHVVLGNTSALLEGDAQRNSEQAMLASPQTLALLPSTLLKVGHHGSLSSTTPAFLSAVHPQWAVISAGRHNLFGHPRRPILQRLGDEGARVYRTDLDGASAFLLNGQTVVATAP